MQWPARFSESFDALHQEASARTGLADFGAADYHEGMRQVLASFDADVPFSAAGRPRAFDALVGTLVARLFAQDGWNRHPAYAQVAIRRPLVITGLPRTGSTALHKLLAMDPQFQGPEMWLTATPMVRPPHAAWDANPWYRQFVDGWQRVLATIPELAYMHDISADTVDECINILQQSFVSNRYSASYGASGYAAWWRRQDETASYRRYADVLRLIGLAEPERRWLLKNPGHLWALDALFAVFPDALVVQTHRDPARTIPSVCSLLAASRRLYIDPERQPPATVGASESEKWRAALERANRVRPRHEAQFCDVLHRDFLADPMAVVRSIYRRFELELTPVTLARMQRWLAEQPAEQKTAHRYQAADFGLSEDGLHELFADYIQAYDLREGARGSA